jgi:hypothetical protein
MKDLEKISLSKALKAEQIKNEQLTAEVELLQRSKAKIVERLDEYQGEQGPYLLFKDMLLRVLDDYDVRGTIKDDLLEDVPDFEDFEHRIYELENKPDEYEITDTVVESMTFESRVAEIVDERLQELTFKVTVEE